MGVPPEGGLGSVRAEAQQRLAQESQCGVQILAPYLLSKLHSMLLPQFRHRCNSHCSSTFLTGAWCGLLMAGQVLSMVAGTSYVLGIIINY